MSEVYALEKRPKVGLEGSHRLHSGSQDWPEKNCSVDLWIEVIAAHGLDPLACLGSTVSTDFEGDQWTFYKVLPGDVLDLYGLDIQELTMWKPIAEQLREQVSRKRLVLVEVDSFNLPDTHATDYRRNHVKTTIAVESIDEAAKTVGYFHSGAYNKLSGEDYTALFENENFIGRGMPPYTEFLKSDQAIIRPKSELVLLARNILKRELKRRPKMNPLTAYRNRFPADLDWLTGKDPDVFHAYVFSVVRQCGATFELASEHLKWLDGEEPAHKAAADHFMSISNGCKTLLFKVARMMANKKKPNCDEAFAAMESAWAAGMETISAYYKV